MLLEEKLMIRIERLADVFVDVADTLTSDFDVIDFLHTVAAHAAEVAGTSAAGLMLSDADGQLHYMGASNEEVGLLELFQVQNDEGPCLDCYRTGEAVIEVDLAQDSSRWPAFAPRALATGIHSVHAFPMRVRDRVIGALNVFGAEPGTLSSDEARVVQALADVATIAILQERALHQAEILTEQLNYALNSRIVIEQAKGAVARTFGISVDEAFELIRRRARSDRVRLTDLSYQVVESPEGPALLGPNA
jgi:GAF domain-containing protein